MNRSIPLFAFTALNACHSIVDVRPDTPRQRQEMTTSVAAAAPPSSQPAKPATPPDPYDAGLTRLLAARSLKCEFTASATAKWDSGSPRGEAGNDHLTMHFDAIDIKKAEARLIGNQAASDVVVAATPAGLTFIERTEAGNFMMTSVVPWHGNEGDFAAVTSRHIVLAGFYRAPIASQLYGACKVFQ